MNALEFQKELIGLLDRCGWIESMDHNRQDFTIRWTALGIEGGKRFIETVRELDPERGWSRADLDRLRTFGIYVGFVDATRRDRTIAAMSAFTKDRNLLVISTSTKGHRRYRLFTARAFGDFYDYVEAEQDAEREITLISVSDILGSNVGRAFPFGRAEEDGQVIWQRGS